MYRGDIRLGDTIDLKFSTRSFTTGAPTTLAGTPSVAAYPANSTTEVTAGITLTVDFDARTGLNNVRVVATSGNGYATATNYELVITAGTVGGVSVVGEVVGSFSIENRSALMPTTAARTLDVTAANKVNGVVLVDTLTTYTGNTVQTGDSFARLGAPAGASVSADIAAITPSDRIKPAGYIGDFRLGAQFSFKFDTVNPTTGGLTTLAGSPVISAYEGSNTTEFATGITLTVDFDARTGVNHVTIVASSGNGFATSNNYTLVITTGTVGGISVVGQIVGSFSIEARSALMPATTGRTLVVDAAGLADANAVKVGPTGAGTAQTAGDLKASLNTLQADTDDIQTRLPAALVGGRMDANTSAIAGDATAATDLKSGALGLVPGTCAAGSTTTSIVTNLTEATDSHYNGRVITFTSGALLGQTSDITAYNGTTKTLTVTALTEAPANTDAFVIS